jgi:transcriptional regulator with XRE-family HTH domain
MTGGDLILMARRRAGLTQRELGERVGCRQATIARWERGDRQPSWEDVQGVASACGLQVDAHLASEDRAWWGQIAVALTLSPVERVRRLRPPSATGARGRAGVGADVITVLERLGESEAPAIVIGEVAGALHGWPLALGAGPVEVCPAPDAPRIPAHTGPQSTAAGAAHTAPKTPAAVAAAAETTNSKAPKAAGAPPKTPAAAAAPAATTNSKASEAAGAPRNAGKSKAAGAHTVAKDAAKAPDQTHELPGGGSILAVETPPGTAGFVDLARSAEPLGVGGRTLLVASLLDLLRIADASPGPNAVRQALALRAVLDVRAAKQAAWEADGRGEGEKLAGWLQDMTARFA